ncbi:glycosyltransferase [Diaminobutyricimonas sp. LJ205]|uniref:glycosyltransferase n=1 Tax=Diaminobutyricimonas sp. LJ205 TaxID=2683590 RepID=UPI0012F4CFEF|nr:glycosyltransferase [Diaminobutyricimonas sp. LJ205]
MSSTGKARRIYFAVQTRFHRDNEGRIRTNFGYARYDAWRPYLQAAAEVIIIGRVSNIRQDGGTLVEGPGVRVLAVPFFHGARQIVIRMPTVRRFLKRALDDPDALYAARFPSVLGSMVRQRARQLGAPFVAQIVGDPEEVLKAGAGGRFGRLLAPIAKKALAHDVSQSDAVIYVTRRTLQAKYPAAPSAHTLVRSNVELSEASFADRSRDYQAHPLGSPVRILTAGSQDQEYKGHHTLIDATAILRNRGIDVECVIVGGGKYHENLISRARAKVGSHGITFTGHLATADDVRNEILKADLFAMPSLTEGLPRVLIEAMATGIVCIGSRVGGIPELLPHESLFTPGDANELADLIQRLVDDQRSLTRLAAESMLRAREIADSFSGDRLLSAFLLDVSQGPKPS